MATRVRYSIVKGVPAETVVSLLAEASEKLPVARPRSSKWTDWPHVLKQREIVALCCGNNLIMADDAWQLAREVAGITNSPHMELRVQESDHWDFSVYENGEPVADFSTRVSYFNDDETAPRPWKNGDIAAFCRCWDLRPEVVSPYLVDWDQLEGTVYSHPDDKYPAGQWEQIFDFMRVLGVENPYDHPNSFPASFPVWETTYMRQPKWRRAVRRISVWIKGTYPDVPRRTAEQKRGMERKYPSITIVRY